MDDRFTILVNGKEEKYDAGTTYEEIARAHQDEYDAPIILANVNGKLCELHKSVNKDCTITFPFPCSVLQTGRKQQVR